MLPLFNLGTNQSSFDRTILPNNNFQYSILSPLEVFHRNNESKVSNMSFIDSFRRLNDDAQWEVRYDDDQTNYTVTNLFYAIATGLFVVLALQLLFPVNNILPIDRRTSSVTCATLVYVSHKFLLKQDQPVDLIEAVGFDVLLLLSVSK